MKAHKRVHTSSAFLLTIIVLMMYATISFAKSKENRTVSYELNPAVNEYMSQLPQPVGGYEALMDNIEYPSVALGAKIEGDVLAKVILNDDGSVKDVKLLKTVGGGCGECVEKAIKETKFFYPGSDSDGPQTTMQEFSMLFRFALK